MGAGRAPSRPAELEPEAAWTRMERAAFNYFWEHRESGSGLIYNTTERNAPASPTACGVALSAIPIGIERGWVSRQAGYARAEQLLRTLADIPHVRGFFYHFLNPRDGSRAWASEVSVIDSSILFAGAMVAAEYFAGTEVERLANALVARARWPWFLDGEERLRWAWRPERGFEGGPMDFSESVLAYLLGLGSPSHPLPPETWEAMRRPISRDSPTGHPIVYTRDGSLFAYLLPLAWFDLRDRHDAHLDYWSNAAAAIQANIRFCWEAREDSRTYREGLWGLSAALGPNGYAAYGAPPGVIRHDGTVAPYVVAASAPFLPEVATSTLGRMERLAPSLWARYGLGDGLNLDRGFVSRETIALDQGLALLMIENARTGLIWELFMRHPIAARALEQAGFVPGSLAEPVVPAIIPGNPGDSIAVTRLDHAVAVDADLTEWATREAIELTPRGRRHVESGFFEGPEDASVLWSIGWRAERLYVAGVITDDALVADQQGTAIWQDDCLELFADLDGDGFRFDGNPADVQLGLAAGDDGQDWQLWAWGALNRVPPGVEAAVRRDDDQIAFELGVPLALLPGLEPDRSVGFSVAYHDRDRDGKAGKLHWSIDTASHPGTILLGTATLVAP